VNVLTSSVGFSAKPMARFFRVCSELSQVLQMVRHFKYWEFVFCDDLVGFHGLTNRGFNFFSNVGCA
jgi:hypothetical protein